MTQSVRYQMQQKSEPERYQSGKHVCGGSRSRISVAYVIGLKNDYNGEMRGPYLSGGDIGYRTPENCSYPWALAKFEVLIPHCTGI